VANRLRPPGHLQTWRQMMIRARCAGRLVADPAGYCRACRADFARFVPTAVRACSNSANSLGLTAENAPERFSLPRHALAPGVESGCSAAASPDRRATSTTESRLPAHRPSARGCRPRRSRAQQWDQGPGSPSEAWKACVTATSRCSRPSSGSEKERLGRPARIPRSYRASKARALVPRERLLRTPVRATWGRIC
jgi:hypothetical protein